MNLVNLIPLSLHQQQQQKEKPLIARDGVAISRMDRNGGGQSYVHIVNTIVFAWVIDFHVFSKNAETKKGGL